MNATKKYSGEQTTVTPVGDGEVRIDAPYNAELNYRMRLAGAVDGWGDEWSKPWFIKARDLESVREILRDVLGVDDATTYDSNDLVTVKLTYSEPTQELSFKRYSEEDDITLYEICACGRPVMFQKFEENCIGTEANRDVEEGVCFVKPNWDDTNDSFSAGNVIVIHDVPRFFTDKRFIPGNPTIEITEQTQPEEVKQSYIHAITDIDRKNQYLQEIKNHVNAKLEDLEAAAE